MKEKLFLIIITVIIFLCVAATFTGVIMDFILYNKQKKTAKEKRSLVATGTMVAFFVFYFLVLYLRIMRIDLPDILIGKTVIIFGTAMVVFGAIVNITSRFSLKDNWSNHIKIYETHTLIKTGFYKYVRHPLYASTIIMLLGGALVYSNPIGLMLTVIIFIPAMIFRSRQEEVLLSKAFKEYTYYQKEVGMLFTKIKKRRNKNGI